MRWRDAWHFFLKEKVPKKNFIGKGYGYRGFVRWKFNLRSARFSPYLVGGDVLDAPLNDFLYWQGIMAIEILRCFLHTRRDRRPRLSIETIFSQRKFNCHFAHQFKASPSGGGGTRSVTERAQNTINSSHSAKPNISQFAPRANYITRRRRISHLQSNPCFANISLF